MNYQNTQNESINRFPNGDPIWVIPMPWLVPDQQVYPTPQVPCPGCGACPVCGRKAQPQVTITWSASNVLPPGKKV